MDWIKNKALLILGILAGIATLAARHFYHKSVIAQTKVKQGADRLIVEKERAKIEKLMVEVKSAEEHRKNLVNQFNANSRDK